MKTLFLSAVFVVGAFFGIRELHNTGKLFEYIFSKPSIAPKFSYFYGEALRLAARENKAVGFFEIVVSTYPDSKYAPASLLAMADIYDAKTKRVRAEELYRKFLRLYPDNERALRVQRKLEFFAQQ